jgi:hypothetical protein
MRRLAAIEAAERTARFEHDAAVAAAAAATAAVEDAKTGATQHRINRFLGVRGPAPASVLFRRAEAQEADDQRAAVQAARHALAEQKKQAENSLVIARISLDARIKEILKAEAPVEKLIAEYHVAHRKFASIQGVIEWLDVKHAIPADRFWQRDRGESVDGAAPWEAALAALETDPDAPLPS